MIGNRGEEKGGEGGLTEGRKEVREDERKPGRTQGQMERRRGERMEGDRWMRKEERGVNMEPRWFEFFTVCYF